MRNFLTYGGLFVVAAVVAQLFILDSMRVSIYFSPLVYIAFVALLPLNMRPIAVALGISDGGLHRLFRGYGRCTHRCDPLYGIHAQVDRDRNPRQRHRRRGGGNALDQIAGQGEIPAICGACGDRPLSGIFHSRSAHMEQLSSRARQNRRQRSVHDCRRVGFVTAVHRQNSKKGISHG